ALPPRLLENMPRSASGFSMEESHRTNTMRNRGIKRRARFICSSADSAASSKLKYHDVNKKTEATARIKRTGYGRGESENESKIDDLLSP
ncbi:hypothetical protein CARUB_v10024484mg, partial [Capsella rubella]